LKKAKREIVMAIMKSGRVFMTCGEIKGGTLEVVVSMFTSRW
jgi:hypothetical protein